MVIALVVTVVVGVLVAFVGDIMAVTMVAMAILIVALPVIGYHSNDGQNAECPHRIGGVF